MMADLGVTIDDSHVVAIRGERLSSAARGSLGRDRRPEAFHTELSEFEIGSDERIVAIVDLDVDELDAAIAELDARYLAGEAAAHTQTWSVVAAAYAGFNRGEITAATPDSVTIDNQRFTPRWRRRWSRILPRLLGAHAATSIYIEAVHRLSDLGAVFTHVGKGISRDGFEAEWRTVDVIVGRT